MEQMTKKQPIKKQPIKEQIVQEQTIKELTTSLDPSTLMLPTNNIRFLPPSAPPSLNPPHTNTFSITESSRR